MTSAWEWLIMPEGKSLTVWCNYQFPRAGALGGPLRGPPNTPSRSQGTEPVLVLVSPCFRENVVATCKIGSFLCSLNNLLQKNLIVLFFLEIKFQNGAHLKKGLFLTYFSHFLVTRESYKNSFSTYLKHINTRILLTLLTFFALPILKKIKIYQVRFLFGMSPGVDSYSRHFDK